jgi:hypothetical protein
VIAVRARAAWMAITSGARAPATTIRAAPARPRQTTVAMNRRVTSPSGSARIFRQAKTTLVMNTSQQMAKAMREEGRTSRTVGRRRSGRQLVRFVVGLAGKRVLGDEPAGVGMGLLDPLLKPGPLDPPLPSPADLYRWQAAVSDQRVGLRSGDRQLVGNIVKGEEPGHPPERRATSGGPLPPSTSRLAPRPTACGCHPRHARRRARRIGALPLARITSGDAHGATLSR